MSMRAKKKGQKGFTMLELLAVIAVMSVITLLAANNRASDAHQQLVDARGERAIRVIEAAKTFRERVGDWPISVQNMVSSGDLLEDARMPNYATEFSLHDIGGNRITVRYNVGDDRIARRLAGTLPYGERHSAGVVQYQIDRPGFESSLTALTERFYDLDGSRALQGNMDANNHNIQNVGTLTSNNVNVTNNVTASGSVRTNQIRSASGAGGFNISNDQITANTKLRATNIEGTHIRNNTQTRFINLRNASDAKSLLENLELNRDLDVGRNVSVTGNIQAGGHIQALRMQNSSNSRYINLGSGNGAESRLGTLRAYGTIRSPMYRFDGSNSVGSSCSRDAALSRGPGESLVQCRSGRWELVGEGMGGGSYRAGSSHTRSLTRTNNRQTPIMVHVTGGNCTRAGDQSNAFHLVGQVTGLGVMANSANNNRTDRKTGSISFMVPAGREYTIKSEPNCVDSGRFQVHEFRFGS